MEIFFNLMWVAVAIALCGLCLGERRAQPASSLLPGVALQLVALGLLILILLPAISLTDDLQACTTPAESEHFSRRCDLQPSADPALHRLPLALALLFAPLTMPQTAVARRSDYEPAPRPVRGYFRFLTIRPPPAV